MNKLISIMILFSLIFGAANGRLTETVAAFSDGAGSAILLMLSISGVLCLWTGVMKVAENTGFSTVISKLLSPVLRILFPKIKNENAIKYITLNLTANFLGLANGATPMGIKAMHELNENGDYATDEMCIFGVLNTAAITLVPTSVIAIRSGASGTINVLIPIWITSLVSLTTALIVAKILLRLRRRRR